VCLFRIVRPLCAPPPLNLTYLFIIMKYLTSILLLAFVASISCQKPKSKQEASAPQTAPVPVIIWGSCPQLEPSEEDKKAKAKVLEECLKQFPVPAQVNEETIGKHQKSIAECALKKENWFDKDGSYKFSKAKSEIKKKNLSKGMEKKLFAAHEKCQSEAKEMFKEPVAKGGNQVDQVQFYQSCMDFHITQACDIKISQPAARASSIFRFSRLNAVRVSENSARAFLMKSA